jgi:hypothetical protein
VTAKHICFGLSLTRRFFTGRSAIHVGLSRLRESRVQAASENSSYSEDVGGRVSLPRIAGVLAPVTVGMLP